MRRAAWLSLLLACGAPGEPVVTVSNRLSVAIVPRPDVMPFDPRAARIQLATQRLDAEAGHAITLQIDQALIPSHRSSFEAALADALENIGTDLRQLHARSASVFARESPRLARIECHYDATVSREAGRFDSVRGVLTVTLPPDSSALVPRGFVAGALEEAYEDEGERTYGTTPPERVTPGAMGEYFEWVIGRHPKRPEDSREVEVLRLEALARVARGDATLLQRVDERLAKYTGYFAAHYEAGASDDMGASFHRAEAAWASWANARLGLASAAVRLAVAEPMFRGGYVRHDHLGRAQDEHAVRGASRFPGFDAFAFGLGVVDAWIAAGHPRRGDEKDPNFEAMRIVVVPYERDDHGKLDNRHGADGGWFRQALDNDPRRLVEALVKRSDDALLETLVANVGLAYDDGYQMRALLTALVPHEREWRHAMLELVEDFSNERSVTSFVKAEAQRVWSALPERRGTALYVLARLDASFDPHYTNEWWTDFPKKYGAPIDGPTFASYLDQSPRALQVATVLWPALGRGFSRADPVTAHLDRFLDEPMIRAGDVGDPVRTLRALLTRMCEDAAPAELAKLHTYFERRATHGVFPGLENLVLDTLPGRCPKPRR